MRFKTLEIQEQWYNEKLNEQVKKIARWVDAYYIVHYGIGCMLTSIYREWGSGVHQDWRAIDVGTNLLTHNEAKKVCDAVNKEFPRMGIYKTCVYHEEIGWHLHLQVGWSKKEKGIMISFFVILILFGLFMLKNI